jgi:hypothetical protein
MADFDIVNNKDCITEESFYFEKFPDYLKLSNYDKYIIDNSFPNKDESLFFQITGIRLW